MGEIGVKMRKSVTSVFRGCFRSIYNHPFIVGMLCFLIYLHRSSPLIFSLLVSASPVLICTALLLGTLLSFGQVNLPEIEIEERASHEIVSLKTGVSENATIIHQNDNHYVEQSIEEQSSVGEVHGENTSDNIAPLINERSLENGIGEVLKENGELSDSKYKEKAEWYDGRLSDDEIVENHYSSIPLETSGKSVESDDERSESDSFDSERVNVDSLDSPPRSPWKRVDERDEEDEEDVGEDTGLDSGSDRAESSSPDASMADIMPMLDELHPLLDEDSPQPVNMSENGSDPESDRSSKSSASIHESNEETENEEDSEAGEDENENEGVVNEDKEEKTKPAITWTEEDEKNLMDLGSSEIERNQRLENLILRRRARKNVSMVPDLNLIDLESTDFPFHVPPISTTRQNPFASSHDSYDNSGLPPIPGSAPSVLLPRRNPFDIPYDSSEEKPNLVGEGLHEELKTFQSREPLFKRHESFNVGPSIFAQERQDVKMRPFFVPERMIGKESSYSSFQRQSSELSESKVSSVPETESLGSIEDFEERKLTDEDNDQPELESLSSMKEVDNEESLLVEPGPSSVKEEVEEEEAEDESQVHEPISDIEHVSEHVGHGSQSSEDEEEASERVYSRDSSFSSLSEVSERVFTETEMGTRNANLEEQVISTQTSLESTDLRITNNVVDEVPHREPVYDSSPPAVRKNFSSSSISSDAHAESDLGLPPVLVKRTVSFVESSSVHLVDEHESRVIDVIDERGRDNINDDVMEPSNEVPVDENLINQHEHGEVHSSSSDEDQNLGVSMENKHSVISGEDYVVGVSGEASTSQLSVKDSVEKEETIENAQSPNSDSDVYLEAYEKLSLTPSAEENALSFFNDKPTSFKHFNEVQAHNTAAESSNDEVRTTQESNMPELQELDQEIPSNANSPVSPDFISIPSTASSAASPHTDLQTIAEEADEIKEIIDEGILSELDSVGDFSVKQWGSGSDESEKRVVDSVEESSFLIHHASAIEHSIHSENSREEMEIYERDMENVLEIQTSERCGSEHIDISDKEYNERDERDSPHQSSSDDDAPSIKNEATAIYPVINENLEDEVKKSEPEFSENGSSNLSNQSEVKLISQTAEDIALVFGQKSDIEIEKSAVLEPPEAKVVIEETIIEKENFPVSEMNQVERVIKETETEHEKSADLEPTQNEETVTEQHSEGQNDHGIEISDSVDHILPVVDEPRNVQVTPIDLHVAGPNSSEETNVPSVQALNVKTEKSIEVEEQRVDSSVTESDVKEIGEVAAEKPDHEEQAHDDSLKTSKGKGKASKSSNSSSSSSSSSSSDSSDSDKE